MIEQTLPHYRVLDKLGSGGMGVVYLTEDLRLGRHVALKFLPESSLADPLAVARFEREARTASTLSHPNICTIHAIDEHAGRRFIVMELVEGQTLDRVISDGPIEVRRLIDIALQVSDALDAAHSRAILHRDVKPSNIFLTRRDQVKVMDFGLAKTMVHRASLGTGADLSSEHVRTSAGVAVGTVAYMSPEHARGDMLDARSDLFSLGLVLYEMATGTQAFRGRTTAVVFDQILHHVPPPPRAFNPQLPPRLQQIIGRAVEKDRWLRLRRPLPGSRAVRQGVERQDPRPRAVREGPAHVRQVRDRTAPPAIAGSRHDALFGRPPAPARRRTTILIGVPSNPNDSRSRFTTNRSYEKWKVVATFVNRTKVGGATPVCAA
jgi:serine/threonine protein kinase